MAPEQLEEKYGGKAPNMEAPFWPPRLLRDVDVGPDPAKVVREEDYE